MSEREPSPASPETGRHLRVRALWLAAAVFALLGLYLLGTKHRQEAAFELPLDDAWIHLVYARGILESGRPTYNDGVAEAGFSSLSWLIALLPATGVAGVLGRSPALLSKITSLGFGVLAAWRAGSLVTRWSSLPAASCATAIALLLAPAFAFASLSGMEVTLTTAAWLSAYVALDDLARAPGEPTDRAATRVGVWLAVALGARLESIAALPAFAAATWWLLRGRLTAKRALRLAGPGALLMAGWATFDLVVTGRPLPNTFYVKAGGADVGANLRYLVFDVVLGAGKLPAAIVAALALVGLLSLRHADRVTRALASALVAATLITLGAMQKTHALIEAAFYTARYFIPFVALIAPIAGLGFAQVLTWSLARAPQRARAVGAIVATALFIVSLGPALGRSRASYVGHCRSIAALDVAPARWIAEHTPPNAVVGVIDAGAMRWWSGRRVVDFGALNDHRLAAARDDAAVSTCLSITSGVDWLALPTPFFSAFGGDWSVAPRAQFAVQRWWIVDRPIGAAVQVAAVTPPDPRRCILLLRERGMGDAIAPPIRALP